MNIKNELLHNRSKETCESIRDYIGKDGKKCKELMDLLLGEDDLLSQRASWPLQYISDQNPNLLLPYHSKFLLKLEEPNLHDAVKRAIIRSWGNTGFPEALDGEIYNKSLELLAGRESIAVIAHAMFSCLRVVRRYNDLIPEFRYVLEDVIIRRGSESAGIRSRGNNVLKIISKLHS